MPRGPKGEQRPAGSNQRAGMIDRTATGEIYETPPDDGKNAAAVTLGRMGGRVRAAGMSKKRRAEIAKKAARARWKST
jgi:hypothetical protein